MRRSLVPLLIPQPGELFRSATEAEGRQMNELRCLRCKTEPLSVVAQIDPRIAFFECPNCRRQYAKLPDKELTFRWLHPISMALYGVQFDESPIGREAEVTDHFIQTRPTKGLEWFAQEIRLELERPTQQVRDIIDCRASEDVLRVFLWSVVKRIESHLASR
jgi:hypothetical protein